MLQNRRDVITAQKRVACAVCCHRSPLVSISAAIAFERQTVPFHFSEIASWIPNLSDSPPRAREFISCLLVAEQNGVQT